MLRALKLPSGLRSAWRLDCEAFAEGIRPDPDLTISEWAERNRVLLPDTSAEPGPWRTERVPYAREIMDVLSPSHPAQEVTFVAGTQVSKTEIGNNFVGFIIDAAPGPAMMVYPTSNTGKRSSRTRLAKMIESTPALRAKVSDRQRDKANSTSLKEFPGGVLAIAGANSAAELKSMPVRFLFEDEVDEYPDDVDGQGPADKLAEKRTDTFSRKKIFRTSTPTQRGRSKIWKHWERSDRRRYHVPCPHCAELQVLRWENMRWDTRKVCELVDADGVVSEVPHGTPDATVRDTGDLVDVWYECAHCQQRIDEHHKTRMLEAGVWIAENPGGGRPVGFHLSALYSPLGWYSWAKAVANKLEADKDASGDLLKTWTNTVLGEPYSDAAEQISENDLKQRCEPYRLQTVPMAALMLTAAVDVQGNRLEVKVKGWGRGEESWLVDYQVIYGDTEADQPWDVLDEYLQRKFKHESGAPLRIVATAVDSGFRTQRVYDWCRRRRHRQIFPVKGQAQAGKAVLGRPTKQDVDHRGQYVKGGVEVFPIGVDTAKAKVYARLKIDQSGPGCLHFPLGLPDDYFKQLTAERLVSRYHKGYLRTSWEKDAGDRNEALDLEVYAYAAAIYAGLTRVNWDRLEAAVRATGGDLFVAAEASVQTPGPDAAEKAAAVAEKAAPPPAVAATPVLRPRPRRSNWITGYR